MSAHKSVTKTEISEDDLLDRIRLRFEELYKLHGEPPIRELDDVIKDVSVIHRDFETYGYAYIDGDLEQKSFSEFKIKTIEDISLHIFNTEDPFENEEFATEHKRIAKKYPSFSDEDKVLATLSCWWNSSSGFGNSSFRFVYFQFLEENPKFMIGEENIEFSRNIVHRHILSLMEDIPDIWDILKSFHKKGDKPMISWDSAKIRFQDTGRPLSTKYKSTKPTLTEPHRDLYVNDGVLIDRIQAMIISQDEKAISLGWVPYSHDEEIQKLCSLLMNKKTEEFSKVSDERLINIMNQYWRSPFGGFVVWKQQTVHYEGVPNKDRTLLSLDQPVDRLRLFSFRLVVGTHVPIGLTNDMRKQLAFLAENGWCPEIYTKAKPNNKGTNTILNIVNKKTSQYMVARKITQIEEESLDAIRDLYNMDYINKFIEELPDIVKEFYGI